MNIIYLYKSLFRPRNGNRVGQSIKKTSRGDVGNARVL